jgi:putative transposase
VIEYTNLKVSRVADFTKKLAKRYIDNNGVIYVEALKIANMVQNKYLAKSINDASWNMVRQWLTFKAEDAGRNVIAINPKNTSQICLCGEIVKKSLAVRIHECPACGLVIDRDILAAKNILRFGQNLQALTKPIGLVV